MSAAIPEKNKIPGVCYAWTDESESLPALELPVIDLTHPAFHFEITLEQTNALIESFVASTQRLSQTPPAVLQSILQGSLLMRGMLIDSANTYTSGLMTYLNKLGPDHLGDWATPLDRQWAASLTPVTFRWRMRDVARLLADGLAATLKATSGSLHFDYVTGKAPVSTPSAPDSTGASSAAVLSDVETPSAPMALINIGGGACMDSLNALIFLYKEHPELLQGRAVTIHPLDLDMEGPTFAGRCLEALKSEGGPLHGLSIKIDYAQYYWKNTRPLHNLLDKLRAARCLVACSSEGGLFEFAADGEILANLHTLCEASPADTFVVGPVVRDAPSLDPRLRASEHVPNRPSIRYLGLDHFGKLAAAAGWRIACHLDGPMHQIVQLVKV